MRGQRCLECAPDRAPAAGAGVDRQRYSARWLSSPLVPMEPALVVYWSLRPKAACRMALEPILADGLAARWQSGSGEMNQATALPSRTMPRSCGRSRARWASVTRRCCSASCSRTRWPRSPRATAGRPGGGLPPLTQARSGSSTVAAPQAERTGPARGKA